MAASVSAALERQNKDEIIHQQAFHDALTGLPNRVLFAERLDQALIEARRNQDNLAVMFMDLDKFKTINDTLGHSIGDELLKEVANRLQHCLRGGDTVARWGAMNLPCCSLVLEVLRMLRLPLSAFWMLLRPS